MAACWARRKIWQTNKVRRKASHPPSAPTEPEHLCFCSPLRMLCKCQRLVFGMWAHGYLCSVYAADWAAGPAGYWYIVQVNGSWSRYYHPVNAAGHWCRQKKEMTFWSRLWELLCSLRRLLVLIIFGRLALSVFFFLPYTVATCSVWNS